MAKVNENFLKLDEDYLFQKTLNKTNEYKSKNPNKEIINLGIGDVSLRLVQGYDFLINRILEVEYKARNIELDNDEIFVAAGTKGDLAGIIELLSIDNKVALMDPVYPAYRDANIMMGRGDIVYLEGNEENNFLPDLPKEHVDIIYLCSPNNPTGAVLNKEQLQMWVNYAKENDSIILYDSVYEAFITDSLVPHSIYEIDGAKEVAIEFRSFSKLAGFTGVRCSFTVVPKELKAKTSDNQKVSLNVLWKRRQSTKFGAASYITQRAAEAVYSEQGQKEIKENIKYYQENAKFIREELEKIGFSVYGGINSPYIWFKTPDGMKSWEFFDKLLNEAGVVGTPGVGFGKYGEGYFRLTAFSSKENTKEAVERIVNLFK